MLLDNKWKNLGEGLTAFIVGGGPSTKNYSEDKIQSLISNNISATVNYNLQFYNDFFMWCTGDNKIVRQFFEKKGRTFLKVQNGMIEGQNVPMITGIKKLPSLNKFILQNKNTYKFIFAQAISPLIEWSEGGQVYFADVWLDNYDEYKNENVYLGFEKKIQTSLKNMDGTESHNLYGDSGYKLSLDMTLPYGENFERLNNEFDVFTVISGGNIMSNLLQLLYYMNFDKVITIGWGDKGSSAGNDEREIFTWSDDETEAIKVHSKYWGDRLKVLSGGELLKENGEFKDALMEELENNKEQRDILNERIKNL